MCVCVCVRVCAQNTHYFHVQHLQNVWSLPQYSVFSFVSLDRYILEMLVMIQKTTTMQTASEPESPPAGATSDAQLEITCDEHGRPCIIFCYETGCNKMLCASCPIQEYSSHRMISGNEKIEKKGYLEEKEKEVVEVLENLDSLIITFVLNNEKLSEEEENICKAVDEKVEKIVQEAEALKEEMKEEVRKQREEMENKKSLVLECAELGVEMLSALQEMMTSPGNELDATQIQVTETQLSEFTPFAEVIRKLDTGCALPVLCAQHHVTIGTIEMRGSDLDPAEGHGVGHPEGHPMTSASAQARPGRGRGGASNFRPRSGSGSGSGWALHPPTQGTTPARHYFLTAMPGGGATAYPRGGARPVRGATAAAAASKGDEMWLKRQRQANREDEQGSTLILVSRTSSDNNIVNIHSNRYRQVVKLQIRI